LNYTRFAVHGDYITAMLPCLALTGRALRSGSNYNVAMRIILNGKEKAFDTIPITVAELLSGMGMTERRVAVEVNLEIVPRSEHGQYQLKDADRVEVVQAIGGG